ncbi:MAG: hypothetical protein JNL88_01900 [Bacteroidia bacterium]|nr:hypothetical protein [Bacteroidia bacterium]
MENTLKFKTNIKCQGCIDQVSPYLDGAEGLCHWSVDTSNPDFILEVHSTGISEKEVKQAVEKAGFTIEKTN